MCIKYIYRRQKFVWHSKNSKLNLDQISNKQII